MSTRDELAEALGRALANAYHDDSAVTVEEPVADALIAEGWRRMPTEAEVIEWALSQFGTSNGTQVWVEFQGDADGLADAILALMDGGQ